MKVRNISNLPVLLSETAENLGRVEKAVIGDDYKIIYLIMKGHDNKAYLIWQDDFIIGEGSVLISNPASMKSYAHGEELSVYDKKLGDVVFDKEGKELGVVSDFIIKREKKEVWGVEISSGVLKDLLEGRGEVSLPQINWASPCTVLVNQEGSESP